MRRYHHFIPADRQRDTLIWLTLCEAPDEWWVWRDPIIAWGAYTDDEFTGLRPFYWRADYDEAIAEDFDQAVNSVLMGIYALDETPTWEEFAEHARRIRTNLRRQAAKAP